MALKLMKGSSLEFNINPDSLKYEQRKEIAGEALQWFFKVETRKAKLEMFKLFSVLIVGAGLFIHPILLLGLFPTLWFGFAAQFDWGDKLDDKCTWEEKYLTRVDGYSPPKKEKKQEKEEEITDVVERAVGKSLERLAEKTVPIQQKAFSLPEPIQVSKIEIM